MVANPRAARHFATAQMQRGKNDRLDAWVLLGFARSMPFQAWTQRRADVMRKLLHAISGMFKHQTAFDGSKLFPLPEETSCLQPTSSISEAA